jgi:hypothetical protein
MLSGTVEERNKLASTINSSATSVVTTYDIGGLRAGSVCEIDSELLYIWEANPTTKTLTVDRGYAGTTAASHTGGAVIISSPRFPLAQMLDMLNSELDDLSSAMNNLYRVVTADLDYNGNDRQIDITGSTSVLELIDVRLRYLADEYPIIRDVRLQTGLPTADFPSGNAIVLDENVMAGSLRVRYKSGFTRASSEASDLTTDCKLPSTCDDIVELGLIIRMMSAREIKRNFIESQGDTRRSDEVPPGSTRDSFTNLVRLRRDRIMAESARLKVQYPITFRK